jgi:hypothetical protein
MSSYIIVNLGFKPRIKIPNKYKGQVRLTIDYSPGYYYLS